MEHQEGTSVGKTVLCLGAQSCLILCDPMDRGACGPPGSMGFSRLEYWSGLSCPPPGDLPNPGIKPRSPALEADPLLSEPPGKIVLVRLKDNRSSWKAA